MEKLLGTITIVNACQMFIHGSIKMYHPEEDYSLGDQLILVVDDDAGNRTLLQIILDSIGYETLTAESGEEALEILEHRHPIMVIADIRMNGIDGFEVVQRMKQNTSLANIPVVLITAIDAFADRSRAVEVGAADVLIKPVRMAQINQMLQQYIK